MKMDRELIKKTLIGFEESENAYTNLKTIAEKLVIDDEIYEAFLYNRELITDKYFSVS
jgi:hypothetical protein